MDHRHHTNTNGVLSNYYIKSGHARVLATRKPQFFLEERMGKWTIAIGYDANSKQKINKPVT